MSIQQYGVFIMTDFGSIFTKIPRRVYAKQWTPYCSLPYVENIFIDVPEPAAPPVINPEDVLNQDVSAYFATANKTMRVCITGAITIGSGDRVTVKPLDYVLYSEVSQTPIAVISEDMFVKEYTQGFELCPICLAKSQVIRGGGTIPTMDDLVKSLEAGKRVTLSDGSVISSFEDLKAWAALQGIKIGP